MNATREMGRSRCFAWNFQRRTETISKQTWSTGVVERSEKITNQIQIFIAQKKKGEEGWNPRLCATVSFPESGFSDCHHTTRGSFKGYSWRGSSSKAFNELWVKKKTHTKQADNKSKARRKFLSKYPQGLLPCSGNLPATLLSATLSQIHLVAGSFIAAPRFSKQWGTSYHKVKSNLEVQFLSV